MERMVMGMLAHVDAGKTTLSEAILYLTGKIRKLGRVDHQDAFLDNFAMERSRGITIFSKQAVFPLGEKEVTLVDTPGHVDFSAEMERTLQILDYAVLIISGADGVQGHTETLWKLLKSYQIPTFLFINKMDQPGTDASALMEELRQRLDENCVCFRGLDGGSFDEEELAMCDETVMEHYLEYEEIREKDIQMMIEQRKVFPCYFGSALKLKGVEDLLEGLAIYCRQPLSLPEFGAKVYKIARDDQGARLTYLKVTGGSLKVKTILDSEEKVDQIRIYSGKKYQMVDLAETGMLCALTGLSNTYAGQAFGAEARYYTPMLEPVLSYQVFLPPAADPAKVLRQLKQLEEEEPALHITWNQQYGEIHMQLMGEVQTEILQQLIMERFGLRVNFGPGHILYKETIAEPVVGVGHYEPLRHYAEVHLRMEPGKPGSGLVFDSSCSEDVLDRNWQRLILTHLKEKEHIGVLTGSPITDMKITLTAGRAHLKHTEGGDFRQSTYRAVRQGLRCAKNVLLEPWYEFRLEVTSDQVGRAMSDIQKMNGSFEGPELEGDLSVLTGLAPASEIMGYQTEVLSYTKGRGRLSLNLKNYGPCHNTKEVIEEIGYDCEQDLDHPMGSIFCSHGAGYYVPWYQVRDYMHIKEDKVPSGDAYDIFADESLWVDPGDAGDDTAWEEEEIEDASKNVKKTKHSYMTFGDDPELEAIMEREFGAKTKQKDMHRGYRKKTFSSSGVSGVVSSGPRPKMTEIKKPEKQYLLVDGYNIIFAWDELNALSETNLEAARQKLMEIMANYQGFTGVNLILVFDAYRVKGNPGEIFKYHNIHVVYTKEAETADQYIEKTTHEIAKKYKVTVATSDATEQVIVMGQGAQKIAAMDFYEEVAVVEKQIRETAKAKAEHGKNYLLENVKKEDAQMLEAVRLGKISL